MANPFKTAGNIERLYITKLAEKLEVTNYILTHEKCSYDALFSKNDVLMLIEAKVRKCDSLRYDSAMIEKNKYDRLITLLNEYHAHKAIYVFFFNDNKALLFNLKHITPVWSQMNLYRNTVQDSVIDSKTIYNIPFEQGTMINL